MSWEPVLEPGRNTRINFDLSEIIVNIKTEFEKLIAEINEMMEKPIEVDGLLFKPTDFSLADYVERDSNCVIMNYYLANRENGSTDGNSEVFSGKKQVAAMTSFYESEDENGKIIKVPYKYFTKANKLEIKISCKEPLLLMKISEMLEDLLLLKSDEINPYNPRLIVRFGNEDSGHENFVAMKFTIEYETRFCYRELDRAEWIAEITEAVSNLLEEQ